MDRGSRDRGRLRLVTVTGGKRPRGESGVRWSRVRAARARIAAGFYDRIEVREKVLEAVLDELTEH